MKEALKYLQAGAIVPVDMETTTLLVNALKEALAQPAQEHVGFVDSKLNPIQRPWVDLTEDQIKVIEEMALTKQWAIRMAIAQLKECNASSTV